MSTYTTTSSSTLIAIKPRGTTPEEAKFYTDEFDFDSDSDSSIDLDDIEYIETVLKPTDGKPLLDRWGRPAAAPRPSWMAALASVQVNLPFPARKPLNPIPTTPTVPKVTNSIPVPTLTLTEPTADPECSPAVETINKTLLHTNWVCKPVRTPARVLPPRRPSLLTAKPRTVLYEFPKYDLPTKKLMRALPNLPAKPRTKAASGDITPLRSAMATKKGARKGLRVAFSTEVFFEGTGRKPEHATRSGQPITKAQAAKAEPQPSLFAPLYGMVSGWLPWASTTSPTTTPSSTATASAKPNSKTPTNASTKPSSTKPKPTFITPSAGRYLAGRYAGALTEERRSMM